MRQAGPKRAARQNDLISALGAYMQMSSNKSHQIFKLIAYRQKSPRVV